MLLPEKDQLHSLMAGLSRIGLGIDIVGVDYRVFFQNQYLKDRFGDLAGKLCYENYLGLTEPCDCCPMVAAVKNNRVEFAELVSSDGRHYEVSSAPLPNPDGTVNKAIEVIRDITEKKRMEKELRESEVKFRNLIEQSDDAIYVLFDGKFEIINRKFSEFAGVTPEEVRAEGFDFMELVAPRSRQLIEERVRMTKRGETPPPRYEFTALTRDGREIAVEASVTNIDYRGGTAVLGILRDITKRKQAEKSLRESEEQHRQLLDLIPVAIIVHSEGLIVYVNPAALEMMRAGNPEDLVGKPVLEFIHTEHRDAAEKRIADALTEGRKALAVEEKMIALDGTILTAEVTTVPFEYMGKPAVQMVIRDITNYKKLEDQFRQAQKMEAVGKLAGGVAHDFNNLLTVISGTVELMMMSLNKDDPLVSDLEEVMKASQRAAQLTGQLLAFSRKQTLQPKVLNVNSILLNLEKMLQRIIGEDIKFETFYADDLKQIRIDPGQFEQIILNLTVNARDAMPNGGSLIIETMNIELTEEYCATHHEVKPGDYVMVSVSDSGCGMTDEIKSQIFDPFFTTKDQGRGTGLGLSTVFGIVKQSDGFIYVYSEPGKGTTFKIYLPWFEGEEESLELRTVSDESLRGDETVLVVEDEEGVRHIAVRSLEKFGYRVIEAENGGAGYLKCRKLGGQVDLVVTDVVMPDMDGAEFVESIREFCPDTKVLYMSGYTYN
ncbi:MAG TPA: PAS domain S-box protein, partial [Bacteroidetes bacterium]|nr:PAS domain S-box protein [Bacteroidota bacterium]